MARPPEAAVRLSAVAGSWYPGSAATLQRSVESFLAQAHPAALPGPVLALISPHAGYAYSGPVAAHAYRQLQGASYRRVVLLGPLHRPIWGNRLGPFMAPSENAYRTPLGDVPIDRDFIDELGRLVPLTTVRGDEEHSLEVQLPFLQVVLPAFTLVPIMLGEHLADPGARGRLDHLIAALASLCDEATLLVCSTDLSHLDDYVEVVRTDRRLVDLVAAYDLDGLDASLSTGVVQACGATGLVAVLEAARRLGARGVEVLKYASSGDITGNKAPGQYAVGYLAAAAYG